MSTVIFVSMIVLITLVMLFFVSFVSDIIDSKRAYRSFDRDILKNVREHKLITYSEAFMCLYSFFNYYGISPREQLSYIQELRETWSMYCFPPAGYEFLAISEFGDTDDDFSDILEGMK